MSVGILLLNSWTDLDEILCKYFNGFLDDLRTQMEPVGGTAIGMSPILSCQPSGDKFGASPNVTNVVDIK